MSETTNVALSAGELHLLACALAGNHPASLAHHRGRVIQKLGHAERQLLIAQATPFTSNQRPDDGSRKEPSDG